MTTIKPLIKWAGGKASLVSTLVPAIEAHLHETQGRYFEPFLGGGAVAWALGRSGMVLNDALEPLIEMYCAVRDDPAQVAWALSALAVAGVDEANYYRVRDLRPDTPVLRAARFLFLNRTGFNGLFRTNKSGEFNVPYGRDKYRESAIQSRSRDAITSLFPHKGKFEALSDLLRTCVITCDDFEAVIAQARAGDLVYADPPYDGTYNAYTAAKFSDEDQERLAAALYRAAQRGVAVVTSNADTERVRYLYHEWAQLDVIGERRSINADKRGRGRVPCLLIAAG